MPSAPIPPPPAPPKPPLPQADGRPQLTCPKCGNRFAEPLTRFLPFTEAQYKQVIQTYGEAFQICPQCKNIFNPNAAPRSGGACFVATAVFGSYDAREVRRLRFFRDQYLIPHPLGRALIKSYYQYGPRMAAAIADRPRVKNALKQLFRLFL
jgi:uncharacterized C2H2 Zn-finger protein